MHQASVFLWNKATHQDRIIDCINNEIQQPATGNDRSVLSTIQFHIKILRNVYMTCYGTRTTAVWTPDNWRSTSEMILTKNPKLPILNAFELITSVVVHKQVLSWKKSERQTTEHEKKGQKVERLPPPTLLKALSGWHETGDSATSRNWT